MPHRGDIPHTAEDDRALAEIEDQRRRNEQDAETVEERRDRERRERDRGGREDRPQPSGGGESTADILAEYSELVRSGEASRTKTRLIKDRLERAGMGIEEIDIQIDAIFESLDPDTVAANKAAGEAGRESTDTTFEEVDLTDQFLLQEAAPKDVFTRFLSESLGNVSPLIRNRAGGQFGNLFNQFSTGVLGGIAGAGGDFEEQLGGAQDLFASFLRGGGQGAFFEDNPSKALRNIGKLFGSGEDTSGFIEEFFNPSTGEGRNRISGAITSPISQSINPFFRNAFQSGFRSDLDRLLANDPGANPFSTFKGFF